MMLHCDYKLGWSAIFRLSYGTSRTKTDVYVLTDSGFNFILRKRLEFISKEDFKRRQYFEVLRDSFQDLGEEGKSGQADVAALKSELRSLSLFLSPTGNALQDVLALEDRMFSPLMGTFHVNAPWFFVVPDEVVYNAAVSLSQERWTAAFRHAGVNVQKHIEFRTWNLAFFSTFVRLWKLHGEQDMYDYVSWCTVQDKLLIPSELKPTLFPRRVWESKRMAFSMFEPWPETEFPDVIVGEMGDSFLENWRNAWLSRTFYRPVDIKVAITAIDTLAYTADIEYRKDFILLPYAFSFPLYDPAALPAINHGGFGAKVAAAVGERFYNSYLAVGAGGSSFGEFRSCLTNDSFGDDRTDLASLAAEVVSLGALVDAYHNASNNRRLAYLENVSSRQLLFIAACYSKCIGSHYPVRESLCDAALRHIPEFAQAFRCSPGTPMNPHRRCRLF
ncbi:hypothetical protein V5799_021238 [Amblyomma americanum]|uniref:Uncharacterized protein n=1 Tax=Amblyomma americanum TaxID=6943 RepID=A0AAQ4FSB4_AMBAM